MRAPWLFVCRLFSFLYTRLGLYKAWSLLYRAVWERKFKGVKISTFASMELLVKFVGGGGRWRGDSWKALWDAISSPQRVQQIFSGVEPQPETDLDCDDYMSFTAAAIEKSLAMGVMVEPHLLNVWCLTVMWMKGWKATGHNVVLLEYYSPEEDAVMYAYMDYAGPSVKKKTKQEVVDLVIQKYGGKDSVGLSWCRARPDLTPVEAHWG